MKKSEIRNIKTMEEKEFNLKEERRKILSGHGINESFIIHKVTRGEI